MDAFNYCNILNDLCENEKKYSLIGYSYIINEFVTGNCKKYLTITSKNPFGKKVFKKQSNWTIWKKNGLKSNKNIYY